MGMYTEFLFRGEVDPRKAGDYVIHLLLHWGEKEVLTLPDHPLFESPRWPAVLHGSSYYFVTQGTKFAYDDIAKSWFLNIHTSLKNYDDEIEMFLSWIKPYIREPVCQGGFLGYWLYEEDDEPHLIRYEEIE